MSGDEAGLTRQLEALQEFLDVGPWPDGTRSVASAVAMIEALFGYGGPIAMAAAARRAVELETDGRSPHFAIANLALGRSAYVAGDLDLAAICWRRRLRSEAAPAMTRVPSLSTHSLVEAERGRQDRSWVLAERAKGIVEGERATGDP